MAKGKYEEWLEAENLILLEGWARDGLTNEQIAENMGIALSTLHDWRKNHSDISDALKAGKEVADYQVENALFNNALNGNTTAQIFWLKNRRPDKWRDRVQEEITVNHNDPTGLLSALEQTEEEVWNGEDVPESVEETETDTDLVAESQTE